MKKIITEWRSTSFGLITILLVGFLLRVYNLTILPVFADEAIYVRWSQVMRAEATLRFLPMSDGKQPLYMWVVMPFLKIFEDPLYAGRMVSVLTGVGIILGVFVLSYLLFKSKKVALVSAFLIAISPFAIFYDRLAHADSMLSLLGVWSLIFSISTFRYLRLDLAMITGFTLGFATLTKSPSLFFFLLLPLSLLFIKQFKKLNIVKAVGLLIVILIISFGMFNILRLGPNFNMLSSRNFDYVHPFSHILTSPLDPLMSYLDRSLEWFRILGPFPIIFLWIIGLATSLNKKNKELFVLVSWALMPIIVQSEFAKVLTARYIFFTLPTVFVLAGMFIKAEKYKMVARFFFLLFIVTSLHLNFLILTDPVKANLPNSERSGYIEEWTAGWGIRESAEIIKKVRDENPDKNILVGTEGYFGTLPDGLQIYLEKEPRITVIGIGLNISEVPSSLKSSKEAGNLTFLVANSSRIVMTNEFSSYGLKVIGSWQKPARKVFSHEYSAYGAQDTFYLFEVVR